jgi:hypothetical protein
LNEQAVAPKSFFDLLGVCLQTIAKTFLIAILYFGKAQESTTFLYAFTVNYNIEVNLPTQLNAINKNCISLLVLKHAKNTVKICDIFNFMLNDQTSLAIN